MSMPPTETKGDNYEKAKKTEITEAFIKPFGI